MAVADCSGEDIRIIGRAVGMEAADDADLRASLRTLEAFGILTVAVEPRELRLRLSDMEGYELVLPRAARRRRSAARAAARSG